MFPRLAFTNCLIFFLSRAEEWKKHSENNGSAPFYIVKPWNGSEGQGISLTQVPHVVASYLSPLVAQVYVQDPLTIDGSVEIIFPQLFFEKLNTNMIETG